MDSQSVTLSEALSSNLICISSNNTAIPEFIKRNKNGFLIDNSYYEFEKLIQKIYLNNNYKILRKFKNN